MATAGVGCPSHRVHIMPVRWQSRPFGRAKIDNIAGFPVSFRQGQCSCGRVQGERAVVGRPHEAATPLTSVERHQIFKAGPRQTLARPGHRRQRATGAVLVGMRRWSGTFRPCRRVSACRCRSSRERRQSTVGCACSASRPDRSPACRGQVASSSSPAPRADRGNGAPCEIPSTAFPGSAIDPPFLR